MNAMRADSTERHGEDLVLSGADGFARETAHAVHALNRNGAT